MGKERKVKNVNWANSLDVGDASKQELKDAFQILGMRAMDLDDDIEGTVKGPVQNKLIADKKAIEARMTIIRKVLKAKPERGGNVRIHERGDVIDPKTVADILAYGKGTWFVIDPDGKLRAMPNKTTETDDKGVETEMTLHHYYHNDKANKEEEEAA
jgi:hypothetical protein